MRGGDGGGDLPRSTFKSEERERRTEEEVAVMVEKGERIRVMTTRILRGGGGGGKADEQCST